MIFAKDRLSPRTITHKVDSSYLIKEKPKDIGQYKEWLKNALEIEITNKASMHYDLISNKIKYKFEESPFWMDLTNNIKNFDEEYQKEHESYKLFHDPSRPKIYTKPFDTFFLKTYRKNILENDNFPEAPEEGWITPDNWFCRIRDIIRTRFVVKYIDGVEFLTNRIDSYCRKFDLPCEINLEAKEEGYYAAHLYTCQDFEMPKLTWDTEKIEISVEIQVMTQLQDHIVMLLHKYYEENRKKIAREEKWQWNYKSDEFAVNYLAHILHYVEGMVVEIRDNKRGD